MNIVTLVQTILAVLLIFGVLMQARGAGIGGAIGGSDSAGFSTRRGSEKVIFTATIIIAILFFGVSIVRILVQ